ncbi:MAG: threonine dehydrogenase, partial [Thermofilum sp. ex4484_15]
AASLNGLMKADLKPGDVVLILGAGPMGLLQTTLAKFLGASRVIVSDLMDERLKYAEKFGADVTVNPLREELSDRVMEETGNYGADITVLSTGGSAMADLLPSSLKLTAKGGRIVVFAGTWPPKKAQIDLNLIHYGERRIIGSFIYTREVFSRALNIAGSSGIDLRELITHKFKLEGVEEAFRIVIRREGLKVALIPNP